MLVREMLPPCTWVAGFITSYIPCMNIHRTAISTSNGNVMRDSNVI